MSVSNEKGCRSGNQLPVDDRDTSVVWPPGSQREYSIVNDATQSILILNNFRKYWTRQLLAASVRAAGTSGESGSRENAARRLCSDKLHVAFPSQQEQAQASGATPQASLATAQSSGLRSLAWAQSDCAAVVRAFESVQVERVGASWLKTSSM